MRPMRLLLALGLAVGWSVAAAIPAGAGTSCSITFNGIAADRIDSLSSPLELTVNDDVVFSGVDPGSTSTAVVEIAIGPIVIESNTAAYVPPSDAFTAAIDLDEVSPYGIGLLRVTGTTDGCSATVWLRVSGRFPLATLTGITAAGLTIGGITGQLGAVASRRRWSRTAAALGGIATGTGTAVLGQQFGRLGLSYLSISIVVAIAAALGFGLAATFGPARPTRKRPSEPASEPAARTATAVRIDGGEVARPERKISAAPYWCYVLSEVDLLDLDDHTRVVGRLKPGAWYLARREMGPWLHVSTGDGVEGWVPRESAHRQG